MAVHHTGANNTELPPRARRIQDNRIDLLSRGGTTSACAENTQTELGPVITYGNYLRVRGEYMLPQAAGGDHMELPPRARRIRSCHLISFLRPGTTSACAENTQAITHPTQNIRNYLRVRGEYNYASCGGYAPAELPPRARRILTALSAALATAGTTSACAENTLFGWCAKR